MSRLSAIALIFTFLALGSGALEYLHNSQHADEDRMAAAVLGQQSGQSQDHHPIHNDSNCPTHAQLHMPFTGGGWVPLLVLLGIFVAFTSEFAKPLISRPIAFDLDCRGPPAC